MQGAAASCTHQTRVVGYCWFGHRWGGLVGGVLRVVGVGALRGGHIGEGEGKGVREALDELAALEAQLEGRHGKEDCHDDGKKRTKNKLGLSSLYQLESQEFGEGWDICLCL
jgi:hypothetical protein